MPSRVPSLEISWSWSGSTRRSQEADWGLEEMQLYKHKVDRLMQNLTSDVLWKPSIRACMKAGILNPLEPRA